MADSALSAPSLAFLDEETVRTLRKEQLRQYFFALQKYLRKTLQPDPALAPLYANPTDNSSRQQSPTYQASLLRLPVEVRRQIFAYLLEDPVPGPSIKGPHPRQLQLPLALTRTFPAPLLLVCKQIYVEAVPVFYGSPDQTVEVTINYDFWRHTGERSSLNVSPFVMRSMRNVRLSIFLGSEKQNRKPSGREAQRRLEVVKKGIRKLGRWFVASSACIQKMTIDWKEPPSTFTWEQKREVLDGLKVLTPKNVVAGEINWGLKYPGKRFRFETEYLEKLQSSPKVQSTTYLASGPSCSQTTPALCPMILPFLDDASLQQ